MLLPSFLQMSVLLKKKKQKKKQNPHTQRLVLWIVCMQFVCVGALRMGRLWKGVTIIYTLYIMLLDQLWGGNLSLI